MYTEEKVTARRPLAQIPSPPPVILSDELLASDSEAEKQLDRAIRNAIYGLPSV